MSLSPKQAAFVREYLKDFNATRAAIAAGYSEKTADQQGSRLLKNVKVKAAIDAKLQKADLKSDITVQRVLVELAKLAFSDPRDLYREDGSLKSVTELDDDAAASLSSLEVVTLAKKQQSAGDDDKPAPALELHKLKRWDKTKALELIGRHLGMFKDKVEVTGASELADAIEAARRRAK